MKSKVEWNGALQFEGTGPSEHKVQFVSKAEDRGGVTPVEALLMSACACSGMDVISILEKQRQQVTRYIVEIEEKRGPEGEYPRPILEVKMKHTISGVDLDREKVARAVELSDTKYCTVLQTLMNEVAASSELEVAE